MASLLDPDGVDIYFLNREPMLHVTNPSDLNIMFCMEPEGKYELYFFITRLYLHRFLGATPIVPVLRQVLKDKRNQIYERKLLILIATDGIPTDDRERPDIHTLEHVLKNERQPSELIPVTIIACTGRLKKFQRAFRMN